jgi:hypothetical protein
MSSALTGAGRHPLISATQPPYRVERRYISDLMRRARPSNNARHNARNLCACHSERPLAYHQYPRLRPTYPPPPNSSTSTTIIRINSIAVSSFGTLTVRCSSECAFGVPVVCIELTSALLNFSTMAGRSIKSWSAGGLAVVPAAHDCVLSTMAAMGIEQLVEGRQWRRERS